MQNALNQKDYILPENATYKDIKMLELLLPSWNTYRFVVWKKDEKYIAIFSHTGMTQKMQQKLLTFLNSEKKLFTLKESEIQNTQQNSQTLSQLRTQVSQDVLTILDDNHIAVNDENFENPKEKILYQYTNNQRKKFFVVFNNDGSIFHILQNNKILSEVCDLQKRHILEKFHNPQEHHHFEPIPQDQWSFDIIDEIIIKKRKKELEHIRFPGISGWYEYKNSVWEKFCVQIERWKVIWVSGDDGEVSPQQRWAIQRQLNQKGTKAFQKKLNWVPLQNILSELISDERKQKIIWPHYEILISLQEVIAPYSQILSSKDENQEFLYQTVKEIFLKSVLLFPKSVLDMWVDFEDKNNIQKIFKRIFVFLRDESGRYPQEKILREELFKDWENIKTIILKNIN